MSEGVIGGPCSGCGQCCEPVGFKKDGSRVLFTFPDSVIFTANEGGDITITVARNPWCFSYNGTPAEYETAFGVPPPVAVNDYFYQLTGTGTFWRNLAGVFTVVSAPAFYGQGAVTVSWELSRNECGCPHMLASGGATSGTLTWADGDVANKQITIAVTCPGPPIYWGCSAEICGGEAATLTLALVSADLPTCLSNVAEASLAGICTHEPFIEDSCAANSHIVKGPWAGSDANSEGFVGFTDSATRFLKAAVTFTDRTYDLPANPCVILSTVVREGSEEYWNKAGLHRRIEEFTADDALAYVVSNPEGIVDNTHYSLADACGNVFVEIELLAETGATPEPADAQDNYDTALAEGEPSACALVGSPYRHTYNGSVLGGGFTPGTFYTGTSASVDILPVSWSVTSDPGFDSLIQSDPDTTPAPVVSAAGATEYNPASFTVAQRTLGAYSEGIAGNTKVDVTQAHQQPYPVRVEYRLLVYEDDVLVSTGAWTEIPSNTVHTFDAPAGMGGATERVDHVAEFRTVPLDAGGNPVDPAVFVCHPGASV